MAARGQQEPIAAESEAQLRLKAGFFLWVRLSCFILKKEYAINVQIFLT